MKKFNKSLIAGFSVAVLSALSLTAVSAGAEDVLYGDANNDGQVNIADATAIVQFIANPDKYPLSEIGFGNADVFKRGDGVTGMDATSIQKYEAGIIDSLPESWLDGGEENPVTDTTYIHLNGASATVEGDYAEVNGGVITITHSGTFYVDGTLEDGQINVNIADEVVDAETVKIFLNGVNITGKSAPAILITNAENTSINLVDGTDNYIADGDTAYAGDYLGCAVIEAKDDMTIKGGELGTGTLNITANTQDGIVCNNDIKINGGTTTITTLNATDKTNGINGKTSVTVKDGTLVIDAEGDGMKSGKGSVAVQGGSVEIKAGNDAVQAETTIDISGGSVLAGGDRGLTAVTGVNITGGTVVATATDNQADSSLMSGTTQGTMLLNCIASSETDGCWKKANAITTGNVTFTKWTKKYTYVLISDSSLASGKSYTLTNASTGATVTADNDKSDSFAISGAVSVFNNVNPAGKDGSTSTNPGTDTPATDGTYSITLNGSSITSNAPSDVATVDNGVLTITKEGTYEVTGDAKDVQIVVNVDKTAYPASVVELDFMGANISNSTTAPVYVESIGDEVQIVAKAGTTNTISDGTSHTQTYTDSDGNVNTVEGAVFARDDIKFKGSGSLTVNGNTDDAIVCKNDIKIYNGNLTVNAVDDGIRGKDSVTIGNSTDTDFSTLVLTVKTQTGDGIKSTATDTATDKSYGIVTINGGTVNINSYADGIQAEQDFIMNGGDLTVYTYEGSGFTGNASSGSTSTNPWGGMGGMGGMQEGNSNKVDISAKGIKAVGLYDSTGTTYQSGGNITINAGNITVDSSDDAIHCAGDMNVKGGVLNLRSADDGMHSDTTLTIGTEGNSTTFTDVQISISKCYEGVEAATINQCSGTVYIVSGDDGYNAAGGADSSGTANPGGWNQGNWGQSSTTSSNIAMNLKGGLVVVNSASGDHDAFDSNGNITITGGYYCANGQEPMDCGDGGYSITNNGGNYISMTAGNTNLSTRYTFLDNSGNVIVSFLSGSGAGATVSSGSVQSGGTISGGTSVLDGVLDGNVIVGGSLSGGSAVSAGSGSGSGNTRPF